MAKVKSRLSIGERAPDFEMVGMDGEAVTLDGCLGAKGAVLFFYPKDMTSGCTKEACEFRDLNAAFKKLGVKVFGVSPDPIAQHRKFIEKHELTFPLLSDESKKALKAFGVWQTKEMYGRSYMGVVRTTVVLDARGRVAQVFENVRPAGHAAEVLEWVKENSAKKAG